MASMKACFKVLVDCDSEYFFFALLFWCFNPVTVVLFLDAIASLV